MHSTLQGQSHLEKLHWECNFSSLEFWSSFWFHIARGVPTIKFTLLIGNVTFLDRNLGAHSGSTLQAGSQLEKSHARTRMLAHARTRTYMRTGTRTRAHCALTWVCVCMCARTPLLCVSADKCARKLMHPCTQLSNALNVHK